MTDVNSFIKNTFNYITFLEDGNDEFLTIKDYLQPKTYG